MRILQVAHTFLPESAGGTEVHTHLLSKALQDRHQVAICYRIHDKTRPEHELVQAEYDGVPVYKLVNNFTWSQGPDWEFFNPAQEIKFAAVLDSFQPDIVHFHHLGGGLSTSLPALVHRRGIPQVLTLHDFWPMCYRSHLLTSEGRLCIGPEGGLRCVQCWQNGSADARISVRQRVREVGVRNALRMAPRYLLDVLGVREYLPPVAYHTTRLMARNTYLRDVVGRFDLLIAPSRFLIQRYVDWGIPAERLHFIQNGIDPAKFDGLSRALPDNGELQSVYVGSLLAHKGLDVLIDAFNRLTDAPVRLRVYGNTNSTPAIKEYAQALRARNNNPKVSFEGGFPNYEIGKVLSQADVVIAPSILYENCPMAILEALYAGRPVVTSNIGGMAELIADGENGLTFRVGDAGHLMEKVRLLTERRDMVRELAARIVPPNTIKTVAAEVESLYARLLPQRNRVG